MVFMYPGFLPYVALLGMGAVRITNDALIEKAGEPVIGEDGSSL
jgi:hypothetical protein